MVLYLYALCVVSGLVYVAAGPAPNSVSALLPGSLVYLWGVSLAAGGVLALLSAWLRDPTTGLLIERVAMLPLAGATLVYAVALLSLGRLAVLPPAGMVVAFGAAAAWRAVQITRQVGAGPRRRRRRRRAAP